MTRAGPNQDINNPKTIIALAHVFQVKSDTIGDYLAKSNAQSFYVNGPPIVDVFIPFNKTDGSIQNLHGTNIEQDGAEYLYDTNLVSNSIINTYINLAERFRSDWELLKSSAELLQNFENITDTEIIYPLPSTPIPGNPPIYTTSGTMEGVRYNYELTSFSTHIPDTPVWSGSGPTNYNYNTYPQLDLEINNLQVDISHILNPQEKIYYWIDVYKSVYDDFFSGDHEIWGTNNFVRYTTSSSDNDVQIQIPNFSNFDITININGEASYSRSSNVNMFSDEEFVLVSSNVAIGPHDLPYDFRNFVLEKDSDNVPRGLYLGPTSASLSVSHNRDITIPPNRSAFITCSTAFRGKIGPANPLRTGHMTGYCFIEISTPTETKNRSTSITLPLT